MKTGQMLVGSGEGMFDQTLDQVSLDDISRNRSRSIIPRFFTRNVKLADGTGYREVEYLELLIPGDNKSSPIHLVDDRLRQMYAPHYQAFKEGKELPTDGTAIEHWLGGDNAYVTVLKSMHLRTVEAVSEMSDQICAQIGMGGMELRKRAKVFLEIQVDAYKADDIAKKDQTIEDLKKRLAALEGRHVEGDEPDDEDPDAGSHKPPGASLVGNDKAPKQGKGKRS